MKKILLFITMCLFIVTSTQAQDGNITWSKSKAIAREAGQEVSKEHISVTANGELYAAGRFSIPFSFAGKDLEPIANSSYLIKYSNAGEEAWGVSIAGAASVTGITMDGNGNVYLIGRMADAVVFNTTSGTAITKTGNVGTDLISAFVAKYNAAGVIQAVEVFVPEKQAMDYDATPELIFTNIQVDGVKTYVSALLKGNVTNNGITVTGKTVDLWGIGYYVDLQSGFIVSLTNDLKFENIESEMSATENNGLNKIDVFDATFTIENNVMYIGYVANGNQTLKIGADTKNIELKTPEGGAWQYVYQLAEYNINSKTTTLYKDYIVEHDAGYNRCRMAKLTPNGEGLIVEGTYNGAPLAFDNTLTHLGADDVFTAHLKKSDLSVIKAFTSGIDEGDANKNEEVWVASGISENKITQFVQTDVVGNNPLASYSVNIDLTQNNLTVGQQTALFSTGGAINGLKGAIAIVNPTASSIMYIVADLILSNVKHQHVTDITLYPNPVINEVNFSETCDVKLTGITGATIKTAQSVTSLDLTDLASGIYFISVTNSKGSDTFKILKK